MPKDFLMNCINPGCQSFPEKKPVLMCLNVMDATDIGRVAGFVLFLPFFLFAEMTSVVICTVNTPESNGACRAAYEPFDRGVGEAAHLKVAGWFLWRTRCVHLENLVNGGGRGHSISVNVVSVSFHL